jgi:hypothetical protein
VAEIICIFFEFIATTKELRFTPESTCPRIEVTRDDETNQRLQDDYL